MWVNDLVEQAVTLCHCGEEGQTKVRNEETVRNMQRIKHALVVEVHFSFK